MVRDSRFHGRRDPQRSMELAEVVVSEVQRYRRSVVLGLFAEAIRELVSLRICIRMVRFWRSTWLVQIFARSGFPLMARIPKVYQHFRPFRSLKLQTCLGFAADHQMRHLGPGQSKTSLSLPRLLSEKGSGQ